MKLINSNKKSHHLKILSNPEIKLYTLSPNHTTQENYKYKSRKSQNEHIYFKHSIQRLKNNYNMINQFKNTQNYRRFVHKKSRFKSKNL